MGRRNLINKIAYFYSLAIGLMLVGACNLLRTGGPTLDSAYIEVPYGELGLEELDQNLLAEKVMLGCSLNDLPPFGWKEVDSGLVDIRTSEDYEIRTSSLYQEGYKTYLENRMDNPDMYRSIPEMSYEEFLSTCNVFPEVDFSKYSLLGYHATGTGCDVTFEKHVFRDDVGKRVLYELTVIEGGACENVTQNRNLILVPHIPAEYTVIFSKADQKR
jgi:hypothetical protein